MLFTNPHTSPSKRIRGRSITLFIYIEIITFIMSKSYYQHPHPDTILTAQSHTRWNHKLYYQSLSCVRKGQVFDIRQLSYKSHWVATSQHEAEPRRHARVTWLKIRPIRARYSAWSSNNCNRGHVATARASHRAMVITGSQWALSSNWALLPCCYRVLWIGKSYFGILQLRFCCWALFC